MTQTFSSNSLRHYRRGFGVAPILYMLGLVGVVAGTVFSSNMQVLKGNIAVQNSLTVRSDLQAASSTLSAQAILGSDNQTLCPPRSSSLSSGNICAAAPVALVPFAEFTGTQYLPSGFAPTSASGAPEEVGLFAAGSGLKQLDPYGHAYIYCRWENTRNNPAAPAFVLLSAGPDGILQTRCGESTVQGDDAMTIVTVGALIDRAAVWQADTSNDVSYGATGSKVTIDGNGNLTAAGNITGNTGLFSSLHVTGISKQDGAATFGGLLTAGSTSLGTTGMTELMDSGNAAIAGQLGIGVSNPTQTLDVQGNVYVRNSGLFMGAGQDQPIYVNAGDYDAGLGFTDVSGNGTASTQLFTNDLPRLTIASNGNVGIGTTSPATTLDVMGQIRGTANIILNYPAGNYRTYEVQSAGVNRWVWGSDNSTESGANSGSNFYLQAWTDAGVPGAVPLAINRATSTLTVGGPTYFMGGNVGIGTSSATAALTVNGSASLGATSVSSLTDTGGATVTGALTGTTASFSGNVTAASFTGVMSLGSNGVAFSGAIPIANGGTGANNVTSALANLGITSGGYLAIALPSTGVAAGICASPTVGAVSSRRLVKGIFLRAKLPTIAAVNHKSGFSFYFHIFGVFCPHDF